MHIPQAAASASASVATKEEEAVDIAMADPMREEAEGKERVDAADAAPMTKVEDPASAFGNRQQCL